MNENAANDRSRILTGIITGIVLLFLTAGATSLAVFMVSILVFGCTHSLPEWLYYIVFFGVPLPLIFTSIIVPYLYIKKQKAVWIILSLISGILLSCFIFFIWFLILTQYC
ncbi:MAG: hypothetical protein IPM96_00645 [Ignavibacteria bacterium]|nr:hypothetical protein [Ignavibacteria bacterium]